MLGMNIEFHTTMRTLMVLRYVNNVLETEFERVNTKDISGADVCSFVAMIPSTCCTACLML
jgi:hypothetical protein